MDQLSQLAPAIVGLAVAIASLIYAKRIAGAPPNRAVNRNAMGEEPPLPFEFTPPTLLAETEGTVVSRTPERVH